MPVLSSNPVQGIDNFLKSQGSPMAGLGSVFVGVGQKYGVDPRLLVGISGAESSFGKHILGSYNAWGWGPGKPFASWEEGISTVAQGLKAGYLSKGLTSPYQIGPKYAPASDGNDPQHWADTVSGFMQKMGANVPSGSVVSPSMGAPVSGGDPNMYGEMAMMQNLNERATHGGYIDPNQELQSLMMGMGQDIAFGSGSTAGNTPTTSSSAQFTPDAAPIPQRYLSSVGGEHQTMGLPGFPAKDYFATAGTPAVAPVTGKVVRLSGTSPSKGPTQGPHGPFGWSVYIQGNDGHEYYLTHMGSRNVQVGQTVRAGQQIGTVGNYSKYGTPSHIHMGVH